MIVSIELQWPLLQRCALDTEVPSNITTRSAPKQASKRHKHAESQAQTQAVGVDKPSKEPGSNKSIAPAAALCPTSPHPDLTLAAPSTRVSQQPACLKQPWAMVPKPPSICATVLTADRDDHDMLGSHIHADNLCRQTAPTEIMSSGSIHAQGQKPLVFAVLQGSSSSSSTLSTGAHSADTSKLAGRLHAMQADAVYRAWQKQQESQRLPPAAASSKLAPNSAAAAAASKLFQGPHPSGLAAVTFSAHAVGHSNVARQHPPTASQQVPIHSKRPATTADAAAVRPVEASLAPSAQPTADSCKPPPGPTTSSGIQTNKRPGSHGGDLSSDTESLVAKLRALSQGRNDNAQSKASSKSSRQQDQRYPFASRGTNSNQPKPIADLKAAPASKRAKQVGTHTTDTAATTFHAAAAIAAAGPSQPRPRPNTARCIQLLEPVHSGTEYGSGTSPKRRSMHSHAASPVASNRLRSGYASVAAPIQLSAPTAQPPTTALPSSLPAPIASAASAAAAAPAAAPRRVHDEQVPASPVQHRLGKPTPLKKGFTPKPTRFRLEAERLSLTPPDKPSGLEKVLFRSPVKAAAAPSNFNPACNENVIAGCDGAAAPEAGPLADQSLWQAATGAGPGVSDPCSDQMDEAVSSQAMVTAANSFTPVMLAGPSALPQGVFAEMKVILDPELSPQEGQRYSPLQQACICSCRQCW